MNDTEPLIYRKMPQTKTPIVSFGNPITVFWVSIITLAVIVLVLYSNTYNVPFNYDDIRAIDNRHIRISELSVDSIIDAGFRGLSKRRAVANISFALNYYFHKHWMPGYHVVNILIHVVTSILLFLLIKTTMNLPVLRARYGPPTTWVPYLAALFWCISPLQIQAVTYTVQRMTSLAAMFFILSLLLYVKGRLNHSIYIKTVLFVGSFIAGILAFGSKEISLPLPFFIILYEFYFIQDLDFNFIKKNLYIPVLFVIFAGCLIYFFLGSSPLDHILAGYKKHPFTLGERLLTESRVIFFYLSLLAFPALNRLNILHDFSFSHSLFDPLTTLLSAFGIIALLACAIYYAKRERIFSFTILWFLGTLAIESTFIPLALIYEHRLYLPSTFVFLFAVLLGKKLISDQKAALIVTLCIALFFSICTYQRNALWGHPVAFWKDALDKTPRSARVHNNYGYHLSTEGRSNEAVSIFKRSLTFDSTSQSAGRTYYNLGVIMGEMGRYREAVKAYLNSDRLLPGQNITHANLGDMYEHLRNFKKANHHLSKAVAIDPYDTIALYTLALVSAKQKDYVAAQKHYSKLLELDPGHAKAAKDLKMVMYYQQRR